MTELLIAVILVCHRRAQQIVVLNIAHTIDAYLWSDSEWTLKSASKRGCVLLLDRLLKYEWPGIHREPRLRSAILNALSDRYDLQVVKWWFNSYMPVATCQAGRLDCMYAQIQWLGCWIMGTVNRAAISSCGDQRLPASRP